MATKGIVTLTTTEAEKATTIRAHDQKGNVIVQAIIRPKEGAAWRKRISDAVVFEAQRLGYTVAASSASAVPYGTNLW